MNQKICCVTGHRPEGFPWDYYDKNNKSQIEYRSTLKATVERYVKEGYTHFISGGARGVDTDFAEIVIKLRKAYPHIKLEIAVPHAKQATTFSCIDRLRYKKIISKADEVTVLSEEYTKGCMHKRNRYMVDRSDAVIGVWNVNKKGGTYYTIQYTEKRQKKIELIVLQSFLNEYKDTEKMLEEAARKYIISLLKKE